MVSLRQPSTLPIVGVVADSQTYRNLLYLLLAIPLGFTYSAIFSIGLLFGLFLSVVLIGFAVLVALLFGTRLVAAFERWLSNRLLGTDLAAYDDVPADAGGGLSSLKKYTDAASTWRGVGFVSLKFYLTFLVFIPVFGLASALPLVAAPLRYPYTASFGEVNGEPVTWAITTLPEALIALPIGVIGVIVVFHVSNLIAYVSRQMAIALLGVPAGNAEPSAENAEMSAGNAEMSAENAEPSAGNAEPSAASTGPEPPESGATATAESGTVDDDGASGDAVSAGDSESSSSEDDAFDYADIGDTDDSEPPERDADR